VRVVPALFINREKLDIYSVSAAAIDKVNIKQGDNKPIQIDILMNNSAGIFQLDELLKIKLLVPVLKNILMSMLSLTRQPKKV
jgi:metal-dependent HD superfamily phosphatase/phosphodiesterase